MQTATTMLSAFLTVAIVKVVVAGNHGKVEMVDLTMPLSENVPRGLNHDPFQLLVEHNGTTAQGYWLQYERIFLDTSLGTNIDAPCQREKGKPSVAEFPVRRFISPAVKLDVSMKAAKDRDYLVTVKDLTNWEDKYGKFPDKGILIVYTGWERYWRNNQKYIGYSDKNLTERHWPGMSLQATKWLTKNTNLNGVAIDTFTIDSGVNSLLGGSAHTPLFMNNYIVVEGIINSAKLPPTGITLYTFPLPIIKACGSPARVVAQIKAGYGGSMMF